MEEEDWGAVSTTRPTFSLFRKTSPEEEAKKNSFVDIIIYNQWSKAEKRLYQRLKAEIIAEQVARDEIETIDDITESLNLLNIFKQGSQADQCDAKIDDLIYKLTDMQLKSGDTKTKIKVDKRE